MDKTNEDCNIKLLIKIILYLLLALAFFSDYAFKSKNDIDFMIMVTFLFGVLALIFLYIGYYSNKYINRVGETFGYVLAGSFILTFGWFIFNTIATGETISTKVLSLLKADTILIALLIPSIILVSYLIITRLKENFKIFLSSYCKKIHKSQKTL